MQDVTMENPVAIFDGNPVTTTLILAEGTDVQHKNVINLVRKYAEDLEEFGPLAFQTRMGEKLPQGGYGKATEFACLNEPQATLIMTYMSNTPIVRAFKKRLVAAFFELADKVKHQVTFNISYKLDLAKLCEKQPLLGATLIQKVTGHDLSDIIKEMRSKEGWNQMNLPLATA